MSEQRTHGDPSDILDAILRQAAADVRVAIPARVERYDAERQAIDAQPLIKRTVTDELGDRSELLPIINDVPVVFPGSGPFSITWPLSKGDTVLLVFSDASLDRWLVRGGLIDPLTSQDPGAARSHHLSDAIAIPGLRPFSAAVDGAATKADNAIVIQSAGEIRAGGTEPLVTLSEFLNHTHATAGTGPPTPPTELVPSTPPGFAGTEKLRG